MALLLLVIVAPFAVAALALWLYERRKQRPSQLEVLLGELGFAPPETYFVSRELHETFRRGEDEIDFYWDGGAMDVTFHLQGHSTTVSHLSVATIADLIRTHPEILRGDFAALTAAMNESKPRPQ